MKVKWFRIYVLYYVGVLALSGKVLVASELQGWLLEEKIGIKVKPGWGEGILRFEFICHYPGN